ncbi:MAG: toxin glutamine deamidase domain-containing protein, partial [Actinoallomurus sp.]
ERDRSTGSGSDLARGLEAGLPRLDSARAEAVSFDEETRSDVGGERLGYRLSDESLDVTTRLMLAYRELDPPEEEWPSFLKALMAGLLGDLLPEAVNPARLSMFEVLWAAHVAGLGGDRLAAAFHHGASGMYAWADEELAPTAAHDDPESAHALDLENLRALYAAPDPRFQPYGEDAALTTASALEDRLDGVLPPYDGTAVDCVLRLEAVRRELYGGTAVSRDDGTLGAGRPEDELAAATGGNWRPLDGPLEDLLPLLDELGPGATAFVLSSTQDGPGHAFALRNEDGHLFWLETQAGLGSRVYSAEEEDPPVPAGDVRVIVVDASGRAQPLNSLPESGNLVDALRLARRDRGYAGQGREHEFRHVVHAHSREAFSDGEEMLVFNRATGVVVETDTSGLYLAGGRYFATEQAARASRRGRVREVSVKIVEVVSRPERVLLAGEQNRYDPEVIRAGIRDARRRLNNAVRLRNGAAGPGFRGTSLRDLFGDDPTYEYGPRADDLSVLLPPGFTGSAYTHITEGVPLTFALHFLRVTQRFAIERDLKRYLRGGSRFGEDMTLTYLDERIGLRVGRFAAPAMEHLPSVAETRAAMTFLNTHAFATAHVFVRDDESLAKNLVYGALRTAFAGIRESLPEEVQDFLESHRDRIRATLGQDIRERLAPAIRAYERRRNARRLFDYPLNDESMTIGDYVDNMLLPEEDLDVYVNEYDAISVRTNFRALDTNQQRLAIPLILLEMRDVGPPTQSLEAAERTSDAFAVLARQTYALAERVARNNATPEGRQHNRTVATSVRTVSAYHPPGTDLATDVRGFLDSVARNAPDAVRDPIFRENVTSNLQADAVIALSEFIESPDRDTARELRHAVQAIRGAFATQRDAMRTRRGELADLRRRADRVIRELRRHSDRRYPDPEYVNDAGPVTPEPRTGPPRWHDIRSADGRTVGRAYFDDKDWKARSSFYGALRGAEFQSWSGPPGDRVATPVEVPVGDRSKVYILAGHGSQLTDPVGLARTTAREIVAQGFTTLLLLRCAPEAGTETGGLRQVAQDLGLTIIEETGAVAPTHGVINLLPDAEGRPTGVRVYHPDGNVGHHGAFDDAGPPSPEAVRLVGMSAADREAHLASMAPEERARLAADASTVSALRAGLTAREFASAAAHLMIEVPPEARQPDVARTRLHALYARMLHDPDVAERMLTSGARVFVVPRNRPVTSLAPWRHLDGVLTAPGDPKLWADVHAHNQAVAGMTAVAEEHLLDADPASRPGIVRELARALHAHGLTFEDRMLIYRRINERGDALDAGYRPPDQDDLFARLSDVHLGVDAPRANADRLRTREPRLADLLERIYGPSDSAARTRASDEIFDREVRAEEPDGTLPPEDGLAVGHRPAGVPEQSSPVRLGRRGGEVWGAGAVLHEVRDDDGRFHGLASYAPEDLAVRPPAPASSVAWHAGSDGEPVPAGHSLPAGPDTFRWFSPGATRSSGGLVDLIEDWVGEFADIVVWSRQMAPALDRGATLAPATLIGERTGRRTHAPDREVALGRAPRTGSAAARTSPDPLGGETGPPRPATSSEPGVVLADLPVLLEEGETFGRALARALDGDTSLLPERDGSGTETAPAGGAYERLLASLTEEDPPGSAPLVEETAQVHVDDLG